MFYSCILIKIFRKQSFMYLLRVVTLMLACVEERTKSHPYFALEMLEAFKEFMTNRVCDWLKRVGHRRCTQSTGRLSPLTERKHRVQLLNKSYCPTTVMTNSERYIHG